MIVFLLLLLGAVMNDTSARDVISFNTGWQFKKGPFSTDPMRASAQWDGKWEEVTIPHTLAYIIGLQKNLFASPRVFSKRKRHPITY